VWWFPSVIPGTVEVQVGGLNLKANLGKIHETLYIYKKKVLGGGKN
jgi:hypothetical protein